MKASGTMTRPFFFISNIPKFEFQHFYSISFKLCQGKDLPPLDSAKEMTHLFWVQPREESSPVDTTTFWIILSIHS